ncbi:MAG: class I mannose-6-phosphate isomerase [Bacteroidales bacterium]|nr:class I mannose-6-phosphate isomerase [Bacteroidales bacterium]
MNELYPLKFEPIVKDKIWGGKKLKTLLNKTKASEKCGESWEISCVSGEISVVSNGFLEGNALDELIDVYMGDLVGDKVYDEFGAGFPLLIKFIDANALLSIQVHPNDDLAMARHNSFGKTEMWYIIQNDEGAELISGFIKPTDQEEYLKYLDAKKLKEILNVEKVCKGDVFYIPAGRVHAIGSGIMLAEIQQTSDITYRIYDWDRKDEKGNSRELHTDLALAAIDFEAAGYSKTKYPRNFNATNNLVDCKYFTTSYIQFDRIVEKDFNLIDSFVVYICMEGEMVLKYNEDETVTLTKGETILVPAMIKNIVLIPNPAAELLEVYIK